MPLVTRLTEWNLEATFSRSTYLLARVDRLPNANMQQGLSEYLDHRFPRLFTHVIVARSEFSTARLNELFRSSVGALRAGVKDGYYLFEGPLVIGHHMGQSRSSSVSFGNTAEEDAQRTRILASPVGAMRLQGPDLDALRHLVAYFEPIVARRLKASGLNEDGSGQFTSGYVYEAPPGASGDGAGPRSSGPHSSDAGSSGSSSSGRATPPPAPAREDPYGILGITPTATDDELKTAYRTQLKLNHPDKVAHLSPALQAFAQQQTIAVIQAYESIVAQRRR